MKYVKQIGVILGITMLGEVLYVVLPLPVPAGVYGLFLMLGALISGLVKLESVEGTGNFLLDTMSMMFIPATVGIVESFGEVKKVLVSFLVIIAVSTILVMIVTGHIAQWVIGRSGQEEAANALGVQTFKASEEKAGIEDERQYQRNTWTVTVFRPGLKHRSLSV